MKPLAGTLPQQPGDLPEALQRQTGLGEVEGERAPKYRGEARGQKPGDSFVRVGSQDEVEGLGEPLGDGSDQARGEQRSHVVGTSPGH